MQKGSVNKVILVGHLGRTLRVGLHLEARSNYV
ncbi:MAG: hypothetical protein CM1200mP10_30700 [Candidatus Neomarinimicrobiota bacterium]|nr:MAG: hypothetical protein CM1200mP10_30700 [Candidatus Neomarinimicrobiota bacterium]